MTVQRETETGRFGRRMVGGFRLRAGPGAALASAGLLSVAGGQAEPEKLSFNSDVRPILSDRCFACHGPDAQSLEGDLRLDLRDAAVKAGAIVPGDSGASELWHRVTAPDDDDVMPPPKAKIGRLSEDEVAVLKRWIDEGAEYEVHWAFAPVGEVEVPEVEVEPDPDTATPSRNPVDRFVTAKLAARGIAPQPEAPRETLVRRVTFDLTGLPPTPEEVEAFLADGSEGAYERLVDRLLASPRFGERMAVDWLDLARYADSYGFQVDRDRDVWPWRDWVVDAFNRNLPYDEFVTWQLAGDLLDEPTDEQVLATAFNRLHQQKVEGGSVEEEFRVEYVADRVHTFGTAFLGLTMECARCHDHKFDPVTQNDYYGLFGLFQNIDEAGLYSYFTPAVPTPAMLLVDDAEKEELAGLEAAVTAAEAACTTAAAGAGSGAGRELGRFGFEGEGLANGVDAEAPLAKIGGENELVPGRGGAGQAVLLTGDDAVELPFGNFPRWQPFSVSLWLNTPDVKERAVVFHRSKAWTDAASRGYELLIEDGRLKWSLVHFWPGNAVSVKAAGALPVGEWVHVTVTYDGSSRASGLSIYAGGEKLATDVVRDGLTKQITGGGGDNISIGERMRDRGFKGGFVDDFRVFDREVSAAEVRELFAGGELPAVDGDGGESGRGAQLLAALRQAREVRDRYRDGRREIMVMRELPEPKKAYRLERGLYDARAEEVPMAVPAFLPPLPDGAPLNRLGLARWLTDPDHPLFSRVAVNRFWAACFGRGLVETAEDFGSQGDKPEYRELLDWLCGEFMRSGWDIKGLMRTIVTSHTYRQSSSATDPQLMADDPQNRLLARGPRHRLPAEMIRDNALAASGLLVETRGGPPVKPYEIAEAFKPSDPDEGDGRFRRSLYTYWKRTGPAPAMLSFDSPKRDVCVARRERTNTPLQALILLNGTQYTEAAKALGEKLWTECGGDVGEIVGRAFLLLTSRRPGDEEKAILHRLFEEQKEFAGGDGAAAAGQLALALLNYDGCVVKR